MLDKRDIRLAKQRFTFMMEKGMHPWKDRELKMLKMFFEQNSMDFESLDLGITTSHAKRILTFEVLHLAHEFRYRKYWDENYTKEFSMEERTIDFLDFPIPIRGRLFHHGIKTIGDLININQGELLIVRGLGEKGIKEIQEKMKEYGLVFKG